MMYNMINKKGNVYLTIIIAIAFFMFGVLMIGFLFEPIAISRTSDNLDCSNINISDGNKMSCLVIDTVVPGFIILLVIIGGGAVVLKLTGTA